MVLCIACIPQIMSSTGLFVSCYIDVHPVFSAVGSRLAVFWSSLQLSECA
jgi:hypothetical protein